MRMEVVPSNLDVAGLRLLVHGAIGLPTFRMCEIGLPAEFRTSYYGTLYQVDQNFRCAMRMQCIGSPLNTLLCLTALGVVIKVRRLYGGHILLFHAPKISQRKIQIALLLTLCCMFAFLFIADLDILLFECKRKGLQPISATMSETNIQKPPSEANWRDNKPD